ncbi:MAG TPA: DUF6062 family protein [bacterium]|nr:DUF6062 family protein [bacterium]
MPSFADPDRFLSLFQPDRCPLCFTVRNYAYEHLRSLLDESVTDPVTRDKLFGSKGFCRHHAWMGVHQRQALGMGVIYGSLLDRGLKELSAPPRLFKKKDARPCPLCVSEEERDLSVTKEFALAWDESEELRKAFGEKGILCLPHLTRTLDEKMSTEKRRELAMAGRKALEKLAQELNEFLEKQDYHRSQEALGKEWDAWVRAVRMISGERD